MKKAIEGVDQILYIPLGGTYFTEKDMDTIVGHGNMDSYNKELVYALHKGIAARWFPSLFY